ncbi:Transcription factor himD [Hyphodiscus hymeniophilus]|uniref:Transcription factor himD n=1 Tax=Hyphodiscus hymeniophilus TaxID=353542 RepID=A0A9P6VHB0_9HELO|nr:Transcription factor himD [Hyphodiscus hymeniophilus]
MTRKQIAREPESGEMRTSSRSADEAPHEALSSPINIRVVTHNIRYATGAPFKGEERWPVRAPRLSSELVFNSVIPATFICLQEVLHNQLVDISTALNQSADIGGEWEYIGVGRDDGKEAGEYSPIFYRPSVWKLKSWDTCWLSETPRVPSKGWDASSTRIATIGQFIHCGSGKLVIVVSTHLDDQGAKSRKESAKLILGVLEVEAGLAGAEAVLLAGDFNSAPDDEAYLVVTNKDSGMADVHDLVTAHKRYGNELTFTGFHHESEPKRIDFIFSRKKDNIKYGTYAVLPNRFDDGVYSQKFPFGNSYKKLASTSNSSMFLVKASSTVIVSVLDVLARSSDPGQTRSILPNANSFGISHSTIGMSENGTHSPRLRNAKACEACRSSKSRCSFRDEHKVCQRCEHNGTQCIVRTKARPMRVRPSRSGQQSALDQLSRAAESEFSINLPTVTAPDSGADVEELHHHHKDVFVDDEEDDQQDGESRDRPRIRPPLIEQRKIDRKQAEELLLAFRSKAPFFPFVNIPLEATVPSLSKTHPFLLLAILTVASSGDPKLYHQLDHEFRRILSSKVIVEGQKSLDFLQGMLIYIAWYPMHSKPKNNQAFIYMNLAISIAVDLGLDQAYPNTNVFTSMKREGLSMGFQKPNNLHYRNLMNDRGEALLQHETDGNFTSNDITSLVKLQHLTERIGEVHQMSRSQAGDEVQDGCLLTVMNIQMFLNELQEWRTTTSAEIQSLPFVGLADRFANITIYSHELGFLRRPYRDVLKSADPDTPANQSHLFSCLDACKRFFEYLITIPEIEYTKFCTVQWAAVVQSILVLSRLTFLMASNQNWTPEITRANIPLVMYLDALCYRFQAVSSTDTPTSSSERAKDPDVFYVFKLILSSVKKSYERRVAAIAPKSFIVEMGKAVGPARGHCPMLDPNLSVYFDQNLEMQIDDSTYGGSWDYMNGSTPESGAAYMNTTMAPNPPVYFDLWATMTGTWAAEL